MASHSRLENQPPLSEVELFEQAVSLSSTKARVEFLAAACSGNEGLQRRVQGLLEAHFGAEGFLPDRVASGGFSGLELPPSLDRFRVLERIGEGGFGEIWLAEQLEPVRRKVAVKFLKPGVDSRQVIARFELERQALAVMSHPNIARIYDAGAANDGRPFFVMEWVQGKWITEYVAEHDLPIRERLQLIMLVCQAIQHAHQKGVIHRDIKPSNVLVAEQDGEPVPKVIDFGIAKAIQEPLTDSTIVTNFQHFLGTPAYISPEQALVTSTDIDTRSDIYSLGALLYELLTGTPPFESELLLAAGLDEMRRIIRERTPTRPSARVKGGAIDPDLDWIVMKCLEKDRARRYETANGLAMDLQRYMNSEPIVARPPSAAYRISKLVRRNPVVSSLVLLLVLSVGAALVVGAAMNLRMTQAKLETERANQRLAESIRFLESERMEERAAEGLHSQPMAWLARRLREDPHDRVAGMRLISTLQRCNFALPVLAPFTHEGSVHSAEFSEDGSEIMTAADDGIVAFWDAADGGLLRAITNETGVAKAAYLSRGTRLVVVGRDAVARILDPHRGAQVFEVARVSDPIGGCFEADKGRKLFVTQTGGEISQWDLQSGVRTALSLRIPTEISATAYSDPGSCLAVVGSDRTIYLFNAVDGRPLAEPMRFERWNGGVAFTPDGTRLFVSQAHPHGVSLWDFMRPERVPEFVPTLATEIAILRFVPGGDRLLTWSWNSPLRVWDVSKFETVGNPISAGMHPNFFFSHRGDHVASASQAGITLVCDLDRTHVLLEPIEHEGSVLTVDFSPDDQRLITASVDGTARVWDIRMRLPQGTSFPTSTGGGTAVFDGSGQRVVLSVDVSGVQVCDTRTGDPLGPILRHPHRDAHIRYAWFSPDDASLLTVGQEGLLRIWNAQTFEMTMEVAVGAEVLMAKYSPDGRSIVTGTRGADAGILDSRTGERLATVDHHQKEIVSLDLHPTEPLLITGCVDGLARIASLKDGQLTLPPLKHRSIVWSARFSPDGERIVTASADKTALVWNARTGEPLSRAMRHTRDVFLAIFSPDGSRVLTGSEDGTARVWDAATGDPVTPLLRHRARIWVGAFSPDGTMVATGSDDRSLRVWDARSGLPMSEPLRHDGPLGRVSFQRDGRRILTFGGQPRIWDLIVPPAPVPEWFCEFVEALAGRRMAVDGQWHPTAPDAFIQMKSQVPNHEGADFYSRWAHWFLSERMSEPAREFGDEPGK